MSAPKVRGPALLCGGCADRLWVWCQWCVGGCSECEPYAVTHEVGTIPCPSCNGGESKPTEPRWL